MLLSAIGFPEVSVDGFGLVMFLTQIVMGLAVNGDAKRLVGSRSGLFLFGPFMWGWLVFVFGLVGLAVYWVVHHSTLRSVDPPPSRLDSR